MTSTTSQAIAYVVDDHPSPRQAITELLDSIGLRTREFDTAEEFLDKYDPATPGCVFVDVCLPGMSGLNLQDELRTRRHSIPVIMISAHADVPMAVDAMRKGAFRFIEKPFRAHELVEAAKEAIRVDETNRGLEAQNRRVLELFERLTDREAEVARLLTAGAANKQIARQLGISERTVETHRAHLMNKLEVDSLAGMVGLSLQHGRVRENHSHRQ